MTTASPATGLARLLTLGFPIGLILSVVAALLLGAVLSGHFAVLRLPVPTGPYEVGTVTRSVDIPVTDSGGTDIGPPRRIDLELWYPAVDVSATRRAAYRAADSHGAPLLTRFLRDLMQADSYLDASVADGSHSVLLYFPAWGGTRADNTVLAQNLASHGFVVVGMDDLYPSRPMDFSSEQAFRASLRWGDDKARLEAGAAREVIDALALWNAADETGRFTSHLDLKRLGAFGFSYGGAVAGELARVDSRVHAAADMDGWLFSDAATKGVSQPFLILGGKDPARRQDDSTLPIEDHYAAVLDAIDGRQISAGFHRYGGFLLTIPGAQHYNFSDLAFLPTVRHTSLGPIDGKRAASVIEEYLSEFFGHYLNGLPAPLLAPSRAGSEPSLASQRVDVAAQLEVWPPPKSQRAATPHLRVLRKPPIR